MAFEEIKTRLTVTSVLALPDISLPFKLSCDASKLKIGAVIQQSARPIAFFSLKLSGPRLCYCIYDLEFYVIFRTVRH